MMPRGPAGLLRRVAGRTGAASTRIVNRAARWVYAGRRLDMQGLADALGVLTQRTLEMAAERWEAERPPGALHTTGTGRHLNALVSESKGLRRLLDDEPALTLRLLTDPKGRIQQGIVDFVEALLRRDMAEFGFVP